MTVDGFRSRKMQNVLDAAGRALVLQHSEKRDAWSHDALPCLASRSSIGKTESSAYFEQLLLTILTEVAVK